MTDTSTTEDPAVIEQDIRRTQDEMSRTVDKIGDQLTLKNVFNALLDKADENNVDARMLVDGARRNPVALGLIAAGAIWLVSDKDSKFPTVRSGKSRDGDEFDFDGHDVHHRDYVSCMSAVEMRDGEEDSSYQRRRDLARANFFMVEPNYDEDHQSFRQRLDGMSEKFRDKRRAWSDSTSQASSAAKQQGEMALSRAQDMYVSNPLVGGILAAAIGAALGSTVPISRQEQDKLGSMGSKARDMASEQKDQLASQAREKKDQLLEKADQKLQDAQSNSQQSEPSAPSGAQGQPFIIGDSVR